MRDGKIKIPLTIKILFAEKLKKKESFKSKIIKNNYFLYSRVLSFQNCLYPLILGIVFIKKIIAIRPPQYCSLIRPDRVLLQLLIIILAVKKKIGGDLLQFLLFSKQQVPFGQRTPRNPGRDDPTGFES